MPDVKISDATPVPTLDATDMVPIARVGSDVPLNATMQTFADFITILASTHPPQMSDQPPTPGTMDQYARGDHIHPTDTSRAPLDSPEFTGRPSAPMPSMDDSSDVIPTTEWVVSLLGMQPVYAPIDSPTFIGSPRAPTPGIDDNTDLIATSEYFQNQGSTEQPQMNGTPIAGVSRRWAREDHIHPSDATRAAASDIPLAGDATPAMNGLAVTGTSKAWSRDDHVHPTDNAIPRPATTLPPMDGAPAVGTGTTWARADHQHPSDTSRAPLASPAFTGSPTAPNQPTSDASTKLATTFFVRTGTTTNDTPPSGQIGEYLAAQVAQGSAIAIAANTVINIAQVTLSPGDWGVSGNVGFDCANATTLSCGINTVSAQLPIGGTPINSISVGGNSSLPHANMPIPATRISVATTTTIYLVAQSNSGGTTYGFMNARRVR